MKEFILSCESTIDMPYSYTVERDLRTIFYTYTVDGKEYVDDMQKDPGSLDRFYELIDRGNIPSTSQINVDRYDKFFRELLSSTEGDILHIAFGTGMTQSYGNAVLASEKLMEEYPDRKILVVDSLCSSSGYGLLVDAAADMRDDGKSMEEIYGWLMEYRHKVHHQFYSVELKYFRRSGRMSGAAAMVATVLGICPIMKLDDKGKIIAYDKVRGKKKAVDVTVSTMKQHAIGGENYSGKCFICNSNCMEDAVITRDRVLQEFRNIKEIPIFNIGTIIASHCGPGTVAVFFFGDDRQ